MREWVIPLKTVDCHHMLDNTGLFAEVCFLCWAGSCNKQCNEASGIRNCLRPMYETWMKCFSNPPCLCLGAQNSIRHSPVWWSIVTETCINTSMHQADTSEDVVYYPSLALVESPEYLSSSSLLPKTRINGISVPGDISVSGHIQSMRGRHTLACLPAPLHTQGIQAAKGLQHKRLNAASWAQEMPSWWTHKHKTGRENSHTPTWYLSVSISNESQS